jgi:hypothetical protein
MHETMLEISFGVPITSSDVRLRGTGSLEEVQMLALNHATGQVQLLLPPSPFGKPGSVDVSGITVSLAGSGATALHGTISVASRGDENTYYVIAGEQSIPLINTIGPALGAPSCVGDPALVFADGRPSGKEHCVFVVTENFIDSLFTREQGSDWGTLNGTKIRLDFSNVSPGVSVEFDRIELWEGGLVGTFPKANVQQEYSAATGVLSSVLSLDGGPPISPSVVTWIRFHLRFNVSKPATLPFPGNISVTVAMAPVGAALSPTGTTLPPEQHGFPRFQYSPSASVIVCQVMPNPLSTEELRVTN